MNTLSLTKQALRYRLVRSVERKLPPWYIFIPALLVVVGVLLPLIYLGIRAFQVELEEAARLIFRYKTGVLLFNTLSLTIAVLIVDLLIALPLAFLSSRTRLKPNRLITILGVLPLALPGYVMAYAYLGLGGLNGLIYGISGEVFPRISGFWGSLLVLSLFTYPYLFLNIRTALNGMDPSLEEASRSLGMSAGVTFRKVVMPQLKPAIYAGSLLVGLHVLGDFGTVSLMRFETFSYALYLQYMTAFDRFYAAWLALILLGITIGALLLEYRLLKNAIFHKLGSGSIRKRRLYQLGNWKYAAYFFVGALALLAVILPVSSIGYWIGIGVDQRILVEVLSSLLDSLTASIPAALITPLVVLPLAYLGIRYPSRLSSFVERIAYLGYATPPLAFGLAFAFFALFLLPFLYQSLALLVIAYVLHFMAEGLGPVRSALYQTPPRLEEASYSLGASTRKTFINITLPLLRGGMMASAVFVFLSAMKELSLTFLLSPTGFGTLAVNMWSYASEAMFAEAAPFALALLVFSSLFVGFLFNKDQNRN